MAVSDTEQAIITMTAAADVIPGFPFVDFLCYTTTSAGAAGDMCVVQDEDGNPVARFPVDGPNYTGIRWINRRIKGLTISSLSGSGGMLHVHLRV